MGFICDGDEPSGVVTMWNLLIILFTTQKRYWYGLHQVWASHHAFWGTVRWLGQRIRDTYRFNPGDHPPVWVFSYCWFRRGNRIRSWHESILLSRQVLEEDSVLQCLLLVCCLILLFMILHCSCYSTSTFFPFFLKILLVSYIRLYPSRHVVCYFL
jgi:hypothetical protein